MWREWAGRSAPIALQPGIHVEEVALLGPQQTGEGGTLDVASRPRWLAAAPGCVERVGLGLAGGDDGVHLGQRISERESSVKSQPQDDGAARRHGGENVVQAGTGAARVWVDGRLAVDDVAVEGILDVGLRLGLPGPQKRSRLVSLSVNRAVPPGGP